MATDAIGKEELKDLVRQWYEAWCDATFPPLDTEDRAEKALAEIETLIDNAGISPGGEA